MVQRLKFETQVINNMTKILSSMYEESRIYNYANFVTIKGVDKQLLFELCIIMDGSNSDAMMRLKVPYEGEDFDPLIIHFGEFAKVVKRIKDPMIELLVEGKSLTIETNSFKHTLELSTIKIPNAIYNKLGSFLDSSRDKLLDFNLLKLYNVVSNVGSVLGSMTLNRMFYGIYAWDKYVIASNGLVASYDRSYSFPTPFLFPKATIGILKELPKLGAKYAVVDNTFYLVGQGFECYIGEWYVEPSYDHQSNGYPIKAMDRKIEELESNSILIPNGREVFDSIRACQGFAEASYTYLGLGYTSNANGSHIDRFEAVEGFGDKRFILSRDVTIGINRIDSMRITQDFGMVLLEIGEQRLMLVCMKDEVN